MIPFFFSLKFISTEAFAATTAAVALAVEKYLFLSLKGVLPQAFMQRVQKMLSAVKLIKK